MQEETDHRNRLIISKKETGSIINDLSKETPPDPGGVH